MCLQQCNVTIAFKTEAVQFDVSWKVPAILYYAKRNYHTKYDLRSRFLTTLKCYVYTCVCMCEIYLLLSS